MRTLVHIGQHKTGTTSIQHYLRDHRDRLIARGLYVADTLAGYDSPSHFILNLYALKAHRYSSMKERFLQTNSAEALERLQQGLPMEIARHYERAHAAGCTDIIWSNEGLYLLNSLEEYQKLTGLFAHHSSEMVGICCFRELESYKVSYRKQHEKQGIAPSREPDSYRYMEDDSWLFDYARKRTLLASAFDNLILMNYTPTRMVERFMRYIGYPVIDATEAPRLNVTQN